MAIKNKKGMSEMVAYVILIVIAMTIGVFVYTYLRLIIPTCKLECPDDIGITLDSYNCYTTPDYKKMINMTVRITGFSEVDGLNIKIANKSEGGAIYTFPGKGPGGITLNQNGSYYFTSPAGLDDTIKLNFDYTKYDAIKKVQIIPVYYSTLCEEEKLRYTLCSESILAQNIEDCN